MMVPNGIPISYTILVQKGSTNFKKKRNCFIFSGFGGTSTTQKGEERLTWFSFSSISERRPAWQDKLVRMQSICLECHNKNFIADFYSAADKAVLQVNNWVTDAKVKPFWNSFCNPASNP